MVRLIVFLLELAGALYALGFAIAAATWFIRRTAPPILRAWFYLADQKMRHAEQARHERESHIDDLLHAIEQQV